MSSNTIPLCKVETVWRRRLGRAAAGAFAALLAGCAGLTGAPASSPDSPLASAFVMIGPDGAPVARALTVAPVCPSIELDGGSVPMQVRAPFAPIPLRPLAPGPDGKPRATPASNPVLSCELPIPAATRRASIAGRVLPLPKADYKRIVVVGDTGCRLKGKDFQACNDPQAFPFSTVAASAAAWKPDLVIHVGDYHYREDPCPADHPGCAGSPFGYGWDAWNADFFAPARTLLAAAPWVFARGNHETCTRGGQGWQRFLDPTPYTEERSCDLPENDDTADYTDPYAVPLGGGVQLIVFDSANTDYHGFKPGDVRIRRYTQTWERIAELARRSEHNIAVDHHPLYAFGAERNAKTGQIRLFGGDAGLLQVFGAKTPRLLPSNVEVLLSGHVHLQEQLSFVQDFPSQFVAGFAGTAEDIVPLPASVPPGTQPAPGAEVASMSSWIDGFGFMTMERTGADSWTVIIHDRKGATMNTCTLEGRRSHCAVAQVGH
ncbi:metallophosphoesterase [Massilia sp. 9096]|uniref:metallophosphoesterase family protein n=1 Tax=Massilia sp. 9096 TaxID=1500894 RepID=UPI0009DEDC72|nr:metallophosphoesterase [Massilia sp. 9096]